MGYLAQPHTSAGRVPTDTAYRYYVNSFPPSQASEAPPAAGSMPTRHSGIDGFMEGTSSHLSVVTRLTGLLLAPPLKHTTLVRVELIPLEEDRALAVLVTDAGWVTARAVTLEPPLPADEARAIGRELSRRFGGRTVEQIVDMESAPSDPLDALHTRARAVTDQIVALLNGRTLYVSGAINMLDHPEFWDIETTRDLLRTFEQKERLADLMTTLAKAEGLRVMIGEENPYAEPRHADIIQVWWTILRRRKPWLQTARRRPRRPRRAGRRSRSFGASATRRTTACSARSRTPRTRGGGPSASARNSSSMPTSRCSVISSRCSTTSTGRSTPRGPRPLRRASSRASSSSSASC